MSVSIAKCAALAGAALFGLAATAAGAGQSCFYSQNWQGWSPKPHFIELLAS